MGSTPVDDAEYGDAELNIKDAIGNINTEDFKDELKEKIAYYLDKYKESLIVSLVIHLVILLLFALVMWDMSTEQKDKVIVSEFMDEPDEEKADIEEVLEEVKDEPVFDDPVEVEEEVSEVTEVVEEKETTETAEVPMDSDMITENIPLTAVADNSPAASSKNLPFGYNSRSESGKKRALGRNGGSGATENAVEAALRWLAHVQEKDGSWNAIKHGGQEHDRISLTAVSLLAFLGAGYSENIGPYTKTVRSGMTWLNREVDKQKKLPLFGKNYGSAIALMALSEATIFGSMNLTKTNANRLAKMYLNMYKGKAWAYEGGGEDLSVSGWIILGMKSAKAAEIDALETHAGNRLFERYREWVKKMTNEETGLGIYIPGKRGNPHMTWVGMFQRQFLGFPTNDPFLVQAAQNTLEWLETENTTRDSLNPDNFSVVTKNMWIGGDVPGSCYGIYYGTLAAFQAKGKLWNVWNMKMQHTLLGSQRKGKPEDKGGSWDPSRDVTGAYGGRVMMTALMCLCLEVYYRYEDMN